MNDRLEAARRELREALAVARASLAQVRGSPRPVKGHERHDPEPELEASHDDL
jgi:hypothetical protein